MEQVNELIKRIETLSEAEIELKSINLFDKNLDTLKKLFEEIQVKNKETQDFINNLDVGQIVESSMDYLADEFYDKFVPPMKFLDTLVKKTKKTEIEKELEDLRLKLRQRIIDAQKIFGDTVGKTPYALEHMESLEYMRKKLVPKLEEMTDKLNQNVSGISEEIKTELASNYKMLLDSLHKLKGEIRAAEEEVQKLASTSKWIKEQLELREQELAEKSEEAAKVKAKLDEREEELESVKEELQKELLEREAESQNIKESLKQREEELEALKEESGLSKKELQKRQKALEEQIQKTREELEKKSSESEDIKSKLSEREQELTGIIEETRKELEITATESERYKDEVQTKLEKLLQEKTSELESFKEKLNKKEQELNNLKSQMAGKEEIDIDAIKLDMRKEFDAVSEKLKMELADVIQFLEKSPKYQLLYLINNEGETNLSKVHDLFKIDEAVTRTLLDDLSKKGYINIKEIKDDFVLKIEQKLNPLSFLELEDIFESKMYLELKKLADMSAINEYFDKCIEKISEHKRENKQEAGFLLSLLYLYIYKSKNFELFNKIRPLYNELKSESFYLRLIENALTYDPWESKKSAILENLMEIPKLNILDSKYNVIESSDETYPKNGPFSITKYKPLTLIDWDEETIIEKSKLNKFTDIQTLAKWVWLNGKGANFQVNIVNSEGKKFEIIVSASTKTDAHLVIKTNELIAS
ncbi:MAG: hypothetical protein ACFFCM_13410 [Promethearchaeota archaeon]